VWALFDLATQPACLFPFWLQSFRKHYVSVHFPTVTSPILGVRVRVNWIGGLITKRA